MLRERSYRSQVAQSLHYFARPQASIRTTPVGGASAFRGSDFSDASAFTEVLSARDADDIVRAVERARSLGRSTGSLGRDDFLLPGWAPRFAAWRRELRHGRGFLVLRGAPIARLGQAGSELFFWCFGLHLGVPGAQNPAGDLLGHVRDEAADRLPPKLNRAPRLDPAEGVRQYRTRHAIDFHCDLADVVGLLCLETAATGGRSRIASSVAAYNELLARRPDLASRLYEPFLLDTKGEGGVPYFPVIPCAHAAGELRTFWHAGYFRSVERVTGARPIDPRGREVLELYDEIMNEPGFALEMDLEPGDIQLVSNHTVVHGRTGYEDARADGEPTRQRHLLRLWLSLPEPRPLGLRWRAERARARLVAGLVRARATERLRKMVALR
ncbi:MAG: TauD/TfdA family dioxygenase [Polyangiaceae bacterium]